MKIFVNAVIIIISISVVYAQAPKPIDIEAVRKDLLSREHISPNNFIQKLKPALFNVMYAGNLCFVHLPYKSMAGQAFMQTSDVVVYRLVEGKWVFENLTSAWYNISLLDVAQLMFLANLEFCDASGRCETYRGVSRYDGKELVVLREYDGFDKKLYYDNLRSAGKPEEVRLAVGDTIANIVDLSDFRFEQHQTSFTLKRKAEAISSISKAVIRTKVILENFQRVIINH